jgi:hypothetical protein
LAKRSDSASSPFLERGGDVIEHHYGGPWTEIKLDAVEYYLKCYTAALSKVPFDLWYVDAFAGTGTRTSERRWRVGAGLLA